jgi:hypothetical protein
MIAPLLLLLSLVMGSPTYGPPPWEYSLAPIRAVDTPAAALSSGQADLTVAAAEELTPRAYLPLAVKRIGDCGPIPGVEYHTLSINPPPTDRPAEVHADLNLAMRAYEVTGGYHGLVDYGGSADTKAPKLYTLFADQRVPSFPTLYQVYNWDWGCNCRAGLATNYPVTLAGMGTAFDEVLRLPDSGYDIGSGYEALVLYASEKRITLKYTRDDNVVSGYTIHVENVCVEPSLLALYRQMNNAGRGQLPALRAGQPFGRALTTEIGVAIRDAGTFMDPRSRQDWW